MNKTKGFTIVEMAVVLLIVGLLLGGMMMPMTAQIRERRIDETQKALEEIREAVIGYAVSQTVPHLPCPDKTGGGGPGTANDGLEDVTAAGACVIQEGNIPWATLGVAPDDSWGHRFHYRVAAVYSNRVTAFTLTSAVTTPAANLLSVCQTSPNAASTTCAPANTTIANGLPAVFLSYGMNGRGAITTTGALIPPAPPPVFPITLNSDEYENTNSDHIFVMHPPELAAGAKGEFDDQVVWLSSNLLNSRMISAQRLP